MKIHLQRELDELRKQLFHLSALVEENLKLALRAIHEGDSDLARTVYDNDEEIDTFEVKVEEECLKILALHQPVAVDLRFLVAVLKMNNDLERIGDLAVNIAGGKACMGGDAMPAVVSEKLQVLGEGAQTMLRRALESLVDMDAAKARRVLSEDDAVDELYFEIIGMLQGETAQKPADAEKIMCWVMAAKHLERIADLATNIAEDTIYTVEGAIVRHHRLP